MPVSEATYERVALEAEDDIWEWHCGRLRKKPEMTYLHNDLMNQLMVDIARQVASGAYRFRVNSGRVRRPGSAHFVPDVMVIPRALIRPWRDAPEALEQYDAPLPFVAEVWSRSTGDYDVETKFPEYRSRGDLVIWRIHSYERTVTAWERRPDGTYDERVYRAGRVAIPSLPGVTIELEALFAAGE
jgi:Uma2 family endonuclease